MMVKGIKSERSLFIKIIKEPEHTIVLVLWQV